MQFRVIVVTNPQGTDTPTHRQDRLQYTAPQLARGVKCKYTPSDCTTTFAKFGLMLLVMLKCEMRAGII